MMARLVTQIMTAVDYSGSIVSLTKNLYVWFNY